MHLEPGAFLRLKRFEIEFDLIESRLRATWAAYRTNPLSSDPAIQIERATQLQTLQSILDWFQHSRDKMKQLDHGQPAFSLEVWIEEAEDLLKELQEKIPETSP